MPALRSSTLTEIIPMPLANEDDTLVPSIEKIAHSICSEFVKLIEDAVGLGMA